MAGWWFDRYFLMFTPKIGGDDLHFDGSHIFQMGWFNQPPTRWQFWLMETRNLARKIHPLGCFVNLVKIVGLTISAEVLNHETVSQGDKLVVHLSFSVLFYSQMFFSYEYKIS